MKVLTQQRLKLSLCPGGCRFTTLLGHEHEEKTVHTRVNVGITESSNSTWTVIVVENGSLNVVVKNKRFSEQKVTFDFPVVKRKGDL